MKSANHKSIHRHGERGNAMIYVIIVIALFAALTFIMSRQSDTGEGGAVTSEKVNIDVTSILQTAARVQQGIEQMTYTGAALSCAATATPCDWTLTGNRPPDMVCECSKISFMPPSDGNFNDSVAANGPPENPPLRLKAFHPDGGGVTLPALPADAISGAVPGNPAPGYYLDRFSDVEWSPPDLNGDPLDDIFFVAYKITQPVCARLNEQLTGDPTIPVLTRSAEDIFINDGSNSDFTIADCPACEGQAAMCVKDSTQNIWAFYTLMLAKPSVENPF